MKNEPKLRRDWQIRLVYVSLCVVWSAGCAGPGPKLLPAEPQETRKLPDGSIQRWYATSKGPADYYEQLSPDGRIDAIGYTSGSGPEVIKLDDVPRAEQRHLVMLLDSTPYEMAREAWDAGKFRFFPRPSRTISPFPVMTDPSFAEFFGASPMPGVESEYYDGKALTNGATTYANGGVANSWEKYCDYKLSPLLHPEAYLDPYPWLGHEFRAFQDTYTRRNRPMTVCYSVGTSSVGASQGRHGHEVALTQADQLARYLMFKTHGRARFTMLSDHGHDFYPPKGIRIPLSDEMKRLGYRPRTTVLRGERDVAIPEFGMVSYAGIYTHSPADVARDALKITGIELSAYMDGDVLVVQRTNELARIYHSPKGFRYVAEKGDPLELKPTLARLANGGGVDGDGYVDDRLLFEATADATYPDGVARLWRAFHGLVQHTPDVMLSHADGYYSGSLTMERLLTLVGIHGSLRQVSSSGFAMTMAGPLPAVMRQADLRQHLRELGVAVPGAEIKQQEPTGGNGGNREKKPA